MTRMPMSPIEFFALVNDPDGFRVCIRGQSAIEQAINEAVEAAFEPGTGVRIRSFGGFERRLGLAIALGVISPNHRAAIMAAARVRNDLAHGVIDEVSHKEADALRAEVRPVIGDALDEALEHASDTVPGRLTVILAFLFAVVYVDIESARTRREEAKAAVEAERARRALQGEALSLLQALAREPQRENQDGSSE